MMRLFWHFTSVQFTSLHLIRLDMTLWMLHACKKLKIIKKNEGKKIHETPAPRTRTEQDRTGIIGMGLVTLLYVKEGGGEAMKFGNQWDGQITAKYHRFSSSVLVPAGLVPE